MSDGEAMAELDRLRAENERLRWLVGWATEGIPDEDGVMMDPGGIDPTCGNPWEMSLDEIHQRRWDESDPDDDGAEADCLAVVALAAECRRQWEAQ